MEKEMNKKEIPIMLCFDKNYVIPAAVATYSLLENANKEYFYKFYILHTDIPEKDQLKLNENLKEFKNICSMEFINMHNKFEDIWGKISVKLHFSKEVLYKLLVSSMFKEYDKLITTDVDVVFLGDISKSFEDFKVDDNYYYAGVKPLTSLEIYGNPYEKNYTNKEQRRLNSMCGGYIIYNLKNMRKDCIEEKFIKFLDKYNKKLVFAEQDVLNYIGYGKIKFLPLEYVTCSYFWELFEIKKLKKTKDRNYSKKEIEYAMNNPIQLHYASTEKPWKNINTYKSEEWFKYIVKTKYLKEYLLYLENSYKPSEPYINKSTLFRIKDYIKKDPLFFLKKEFYKKLVKRLQKK
jgi:lipopolysaccharide biosynthesis glycosyltransferase